MAVVDTLSDTPLEVLVEMKEQGIPFEINQFVDAHGLWNPNGSNATEWAMRAPQTCMFPSSPNSLSHIGHWRGKDDYDLMRKYTSRAMEWLRFIVFKKGGAVEFEYPENPGVQFQMEIVATLSGDLVALKNHAGEPAPPNFPARSRITQLQ